MAEIIAAAIALATEILRVVGKAQESHAKVLQDLKEAITQFDAATAGLPAAIESADQATDAQLAALAAAKRGSNP